MKKLISWVEIPALDFEKAVCFYSNVLNIDLEVVDCGKEKMACFPNGEGAISWAPGFKPSKEGALVSFNAGADLDGTLKKVVDQGGRVERQKTKIEAEGRGYFAIVIDNQGNKIGLYQD